MRPVGCHALPIRKGGELPGSPLLLTTASLTESPFDRNQAGRARFALMLQGKAPHIFASEKGRHQHLLFARLVKFGLIVTLALGSSCSGSLYRVKKLSELPPMPNSVAAAHLGVLWVRAAPLLTDEESQELFESNLQLAGLLPVRLEIVHNGGEAVDLKRTRFHLRDATGTQWKAISAKQAIARILKANGVFAYNPHSRKIFEKEFRAYELDLKSPLTHAERLRQGLILFLSPKKEPVTSPRGLVLTIDGLSQPATLNLN